VHPEPIGCVALVTRYAGQTKQVAARENLISHGVEVSDVDHVDGGRVPGPDPERHSYQDSD